jgi:hypothetical protein
VLPAAHFTTAYSFNLRINLRLAFLPSALSLEPMSCCALRQTAHLSADIIESEDRLEP